MQKSADAFRTISEVADDLALPQHVLRFWETRFPQIRPLKRAGGRRYYRPNDVVLLKSIRQLLYDDGYTIKGVQRLLKEHGPRGLSDAAPSLDFAQSPDVFVDAVDDREVTADVARETPLPPLQEDVSTLSLSHRDALIAAIVTIDECRRIFETLRRRPA